MLAVPSEHVLTAALWVGGIAASVTGAGVLLLLAKLGDHAKAAGDTARAVGEVRIALVGYDGGGGLVAAERETRRAIHDVRDRVQPLATAVDVLALRVERLEEDDADDAASTERRLLRDALEALRLDGGR